MSEIDFNVEDIEQVDLSIGMGIKEVYPPIENLEVTPTKEQQVFNHENSYGYDEVVVEPIPDEYIIPDGTLDVASNGNVDVTMFKTARIGVYTPPNLQEKELTINENGTYNITADEEYDGLNQVSVTVDAIENLDEELETYNTELTEQETTINDIVETLKTKAIGGGEEEMVKYSTEEQVIGEWVDGKPIYRKVFFFDCATINYSAVYKPHGITDLETIITQKCNWLDGSGANNRWRSIPSNYYATLNWASQLTVDMVNITFELGDSTYSRIRDNGKQLYVILEYTKATD